MKIAVWFSCGAASAAAAYYTLMDYPEAEVRILNNPIKEEDDDNKRFLKDVEQWLNVNIESVIRSKYPDSSSETVWRDRSYMSGPRGAVCTVELKKRARQEWEERNHVDWHVLGFTSEEKRRHDRFILTERENLLPVLIDRGVTKEGCFHLLQSAGIQPPRMYALGYPNANCIGCVRASSPTYWNHVREKHPEVFKARAILSRQLGARLVMIRNKRYFLDELDPETRGAPLKKTAIECGIFCEEGE